MRILLVEDDVRLAAELKPRLQQAGFAVETAHDGEDGEFLGREENFDAVILDLGLPRRQALKCSQTGAAQVWICRYWY